MHATQGGECDSTEQNFSFHLEMSQDDPLHPEVRLRVLLRRRGGALQEAKEIGHVTRALPKTKFVLIILKHKERIKPIKFGKESPTNTYLCKSQLQRNEEGDVVRKFYYGQKKDYFINKHEQKKRM